MNQLGTWSAILSPAHLHCCATAAKHATDGILHGYLLCSAALPTSQACNLSSQVSQAHGGVSQQGSQPALGGSQLRWAKGLWRENDKGGGTVLGVVMVMVGQEGE
jgi:hypothetical protein